MNEHELSDWFGPEQKPTLPGVYETDVEQHFGGVVYQHWNGERWGAQGGSPESAGWYEPWKSNRQNVKWRGLKEQP